MFGRNNQIGILKSLDLMVMGACFLLAVALAAPGIEGVVIRDFMGMRVSVGNVILLGGFSSIWLLLFSAFGLYHELLVASLFGKAKDVLKATSIGTCIIIALAVPFDISIVDAQFVLVFWTSVSILSFCSRLLARKLVLLYRERGNNRSRVLIVGVNGRSLELAHRIDSDVRMGRRVIGFVDDTSVHAEGFSSSGYQRVAGFGSFAAYLGKTEVDEVLVCLPVKSLAEEIVAMVANCEEQGTEVGVLRDFFNWDVKPASFRRLGEQMITMVRPQPISGGPAAVKRLMDVVVSALAIVVLSPVLVIVAILVKLTSPGPVLFVQDRVGLNKKLIGVYKFRTMVVDAEERQAAIEHLNEASGPVFKIDNDPRITPIGSFLRKFSIDELPQLFNVLQGDMSLVGPRPLTQRDYEGFNKDWYRRRVSVQPGITGLWQVNGRDQSSFDNWVKLDLEYIDQWSLGLDTKIMFMTIPAVLRGDGAV